MTPKILVIDDEADVRTYLKSVLKKEGYEVVTAENGFEGLEVAKKEEPALVILDLMMPQQSGADFYRKISHNKTLKDTPIIIVSAATGRHLAAKKPFAVFDKPIDPEAFLATVKKALE